MFEKQPQEAEIIVIGNEVISGLIVETNSRTISLRLQEAGLDVARVTAVGDDESAIAEVADGALGRADLVIVTGGLGATHDDITKKVLARLFDSGFREDAGVRAAIEAFFRRRGRTMPDYALEQCSVPEKADILCNDKGSAPGLLFHRDGKKLYALPGVPLEMEHLLDKYILPGLLSHGTRKIAHRILKTTGITESGLWQKIGSIESLGEDVTVASLPSHLGVRIRLSLCGEGDLSARLDTAERYIREKSGDCIYGVDEETLEEIVGGLLRTRNLTLAVAESCTGGLIGHRLTNVAGSSDYFLEGVVTYSNEAKRNRLGVGGELLSRHGAVSREVATAMAEGVRRLSGADIGLSVTGIAGPSGGSREKPVGLTYIALDAAAGAWCDEFLFPQDRVRNKERAAQAALNGLWRWLTKKT